MSFKVNTKVITLVVMLVLMLSITACSSLKGNSDDSKTHEVISQLDAFTIQVPDYYEETAKEVADIFYMTNFEADNGWKIKIIEEKDATYKVDEAYLEEELTVVDEIETLSVEKLDVEGFGTIYGAQIEDHSLEQHMFYYKFQQGPSTATLIFVNPGEFTEADEAHVKKIILSLKAR